VPPNGNTWQLVSANYSVNSTGRVRIHLFYGGSGGTVNWDDVSIAAAPFNTGFELGDVSYWTAWGSPALSVSSSIFHSGAFSLAESGPTNSGVYQDVTGFVSGQQITVSAFVQVSAGTVGYLYLDDTTGPNPVIIPVQPTGGAWRFVSAPFTVTNT